MFTSIAEGSSASPGLVQLHDARWSCHNNGLLMVASALIHIIRSAIPSRADKYAADAPAYFSSLPPAPRMCVASRCTTFDVILLTKVLITGPRKLPARLRADAVIGYISLGGPHDPLTSQLGSFFGKLQPDARAVAPNLVFLPLTTVAG